MLDRMTVATITPLHLADFTFPPDSPMAGEAGVVLAFFVRHPAGTLLFDTGVLEGNEEVDGPYDSRRGYHVSCGVAPDLMEASKNAIRYMIDHLGKTYRLSPEEAYVLCSVAVDLHISEVVDAPNWIVSAFLPLDLFQ